VIRGGLTVGEIRKSRGLIYGPGLARAYRLEQLAVYPRISIDSEVFRLLKSDPRLRKHDFRTEMRYLSRLIQRKRDGSFISHCFRV
jgi:hypothetical protein